MKRIILLFLCCFVLVFPMISAIEINMNSNVLQGETVIASIPAGNFLDPLTKDNVYFYRGHVRTSFEYDLTKIGDYYYIYFQTVNKAENNYSINITDVRYKVGTQVSTLPISKSFSIINETADFYIIPGFVSTDEDFSIKLQSIAVSSINIDLDTEITYGKSNETFGFVFNGEEVDNSITLSSGVSKNLYAKIDNISETAIGTITLDSGDTEYIIPFYVLVKIIPVSNESNISNEPNISNESNVSAEGNETTANETTNNETNTSNENNCTFFSVLFGTCNTTAVKNETNETINNSNVDYEVVEVGNTTVVIKDGEVLNESSTSKTCAQIKGVICSSEETCQNATIYAKDAKCCTSKCVAEKKSTSGKTIGWVIIAFIFIMILWFFFKKLKSVRKKKDTLLNSSPIKKF